MNTPPDQIEELREIKMEADRSITTDSLTKMNSNKTKSTEYYSE